MENTNYIIIFILILTGSVAVGLTGLREATNGQAIINEQIFNKRAILLAVNDYLPEGKRVNDLSDNEVISIFDGQIKQVTLDMEGNEVADVKAESVDLAKERKKPVAQQQLPLFVYNNGSEDFYIICVRGKGLWDEIWGNIALRSDLNTIAGVAFDHKGETPGLGAEIKDNPNFGKQFEGKTIYDSKGSYVSVDVVKGGIKIPEHQVDGISGATITSYGVSEMLESGISKYEPYFEKLKK